MAKSRRKDALDANKSRRHSRAVKRGMKQAKRARIARIKASSVGRGKTKKEIVACFFNKPAPKSACTPMSAMPRGSRGSLTVVHAVT